nr:FixH family protein [uncultured Sphingomonas sp.]
MKREMTGRDVTIILVAFFAVVIGVNVVMARLAVSTFGGALAENGYVASQDYNKWIAQSTAQDRLGWSMKADVSGHHLLITAAGPSAPTFDVVAEHPLGRIDDLTVQMVPDGPGQYRSAKPLPEGRWKVHVIMMDGDKRAEYLQEIQV